MKRIFLMVAVTVTLALAYSAYAGSASPGEKMSSSAVRQMNQKKDAGRFLGRSVRTPEEKILGKVEYVMFDRKSGRIAYLVLSTDKSLQMGEKMIPVPLDAFSVWGDDLPLVLDIPREQFERIPILREGDIASRQWGVKVHEFYGLRPYWEE